jgi:hypothetical protein
MGETLRLGRLAVDVVQKDIKNVLAPSKAWERRIDVTDYT